MIKKNFVRKFQDIEYSIDFGFCKKNISSI